MTTAPTSTAIATTRKPIEYRWVFVPGVILIVAFFLPWIDLLGRFGISGWEIATSGEEDSLSAWIPAITGMSLVAAALASGRAARRAGTIGGLAILLPVGFHLAEGLFDSTRYGLWITVAGAIALAAVSLSEKPAARLLPGAMIAVGFFLPWFDSFDGSASGFAVARATNDLDLDVHVPWLWTLWLVLAAGLAGLWSALTTSARSRAVGLLSGLGVLAVLAYFFVASLNLVVGSGAWLTVGAGIAALAISLRRAR